MTVNCVVMDLDGVIANSERRIVHAPDWKKVLEGVGDDPVYPDMLMLWHHWQRFMPIVIITGRYELVRAETMAWLEYHKLEYARMFMRPEKNIQHSWELKLDCIKFMEHSGMIPTMAYDDHLGVARAYAKIGIPTHLCVRKINYEELEKQV